MDPWDSKIVESALRVVRLEERLAAEKLVESRNCLGVTDDLVFNSHVTSAVR